MPGQERRGRHTWVCVFESGWETRTKRWYWQRGIGTQTSKGRGWMDGGGSRLLRVETEAERGWINKLRYRLPFAVCSSHLWDTQQDPNDYVYDSSSYSSGREESTVWLLCELFSFYFFLKLKSEQVHSQPDKQQTAAKLHCCLSVFLIWPTEAVHVQQGLYDATMLSLQGWFEILWHRMPIMSYFTLTTSYFSNSEVLKMINDKG